MIILVIGATTSLISWNTDRKRLSETYTIALQKDKELSVREGSIFSQSTDTLTLVNQTLRLARDASERASKSLENRLNKNHEELEQEASSLIEESRAYKNFRVLVENSTYRSNLLTLASEITGLQQNLKILDIDVALQPHCCFIRGMEFHLRQHFRFAIKYWKQTKDCEKVPDYLKIMALYWIGYEHNNLKNFENAISSFEEAASIATGSMQYELERIKIESKFFDFPKYTPVRILSEIEPLYKRIEKEVDSEEFQKIKSNISLTLGNIYLQLGHESFSSGKKEYSEFYKKAKAIFLEAPIRNKWIWFGYAESCYKLEQFDEAEETLLSKVKNEAELEYSTRLEPRTKVLGQTTVFICSTRVKELFKDANSLYNQIKITLGGVDDRLTVFSQFQKRNVSKEQFLEDLNKIMDEFLQRTAETQG